ncbi:UNVERIFIED_CONTAM: hypothetical protein RMT77_004824 [Armadillidium vulgare]
MGFLQCFDGRESYSILFLSLVLLSLFKGLSATCVEFNIPENSEKILVKSDIGKNGYIYITPGKTFDYMELQPVVTSLLKKKLHDNVLSITKENLLEANKVSKNTPYYEIQYFIHKHSRIIHSSEYTIAAYTGQSRFDVSFTLFWLKGAIKTLNLKIKGGARISLNCRPPQNEMVSGSSTPLPSRNYTNNKTSIETRNKKNDSNISDTLVPRSLPPTRTNETRIQNSQKFPTSENQENPNKSSSNPFNVGNTNLSKENLSNFINFTKNKTESLSEFANNPDKTTEFGEFFSTNFQYILVGFGLSWFIFTIIILVIFLFLKRSRKITNSTKVCSDEFTKINMASKSTSNEYQNPKLSSALEKHTSESNSSYLKSSEYEPENEYELPPLNSQIEYENEYCNGVINTNEYLDMSKIIFH